MPLTGKIPKLDTQKLFDEMVVLESEVAGIIDGSLGQLRDVDKTDEYWEIYTTRLANMIDDYIVGSELVGNTTAPDTKLAPGVLDTFGGLTTAPGSVDGDTHQGTTRTRWVVDPSNYQGGTAGHSFLLDGQTEATLRAQQQAACFLATGNVLDPSKTIDPATCTNIN